MERDCAAEASRRSMGKASAQGAFEAFEGSDVLRLVFQTQPRPAATEMLPH